MKKPAEKESKKEAKMESKMSGKALKSYEAKDAKGEGKAKKAPFPFQKGKK